MSGAGILDGDLLIVDRSLDPRCGKIIIAALAGEMTLKRLFIDNQTVKLMPENPNYEAIDVSEREDFEIWGVVAGLVRERVE